MAAAPHGEVAHIFERVVSIEVIPFLHPDFKPGAVHIANSDDSRVVIINLTESGSALAETTPVAGIGLLRRRLPTLPEERLRVIDAALAEIMQLMEVTDGE